MGEERGSLCASPRRRRLVPSSKNKETADRRGDRRRHWHGSSHVLGLAISVLQPNCLSQFLEARAKLTLPVQSPPTPKTQPSCSGRHPGQHKRLGPPLRGSL